MYMARTTMNIPDSILDKIKEMAEEEKRTLTQQTSLILEIGLAEIRKEKKKPWKFEPAGDLGGPLPGINIDDMQSVREVLDAYDARNRH